MNTSIQEDQSDPLAQLRQLSRHLAELEIWVVALAIAASFVSTRFLPLAVGVAAVFWPVRWLAYGRFSVRTPADWSLGLLLLMVPVTLWATVVPAITTLQVYRLLSGIGLFYAIANWASTPARLGWVVAGLALAGLAFAALAPFSVIWPTGKLPFLPAGWFESFQVLVADSVHPNVLAGSLAILMPFVLSVVLFELPQVGLPVKAWQARLISLLLLIAMSVVLVLSQSRGAWLAFGLSALIMVVLRWRRGWIVLLAAAIVAGIAIYLIGMRPLLETLVASSSVDTLDGRREIWSRAIFMIRDFPFTGVGMGTFGQVADLLYPFFLTAPGLVPHAHNLFLQVAVDLGLPGLIAWLSTFVLAAMASWQILRFGRERSTLWAVGLGAALLCSQLALTVHGMIDAVVWGMVKPAPLVWAIWGLAMAGRLVTMRLAK